MSRFEQFVAHALVGLLGSQPMHSVIFADVAKLAVEVATAVEKELEALSASK